MSATRERPVPCVWCSELTFEDSAICRASECVRREANYQQYLARRMGAATTEEVRL